MTSARNQFRLLAVAAALLLLAPIRKGDLAGYDDAVYAHIAKAIVKSGSWLTLSSNGYPALEHPPGFVWMQALLFHIFGFSDFVAKLPSALCGVGVVLLVYWLARQVQESQGFALLSMFIMLATPYFIKYAAHGMTDVPFLFFTCVAIACWIRARHELRWYWGVIAAAAYAMLTRGIFGLTIPAIFAVDLFFDTARSRGKAAPAIAAAVVPVVFWYWLQYYYYGQFFLDTVSGFLTDKIAGNVSGLRHFTGPFEYLWMLAQSYWPWLPFLGIGLWAAAKQPAKYRLLLIWSAVMFAACSIGGSRVLRYLLPAYPAFSILVALGLQRIAKPEWITAGLRWMPPIAAAAALGIALFPPVSMHAEEVRPIARAVRDSSTSLERFAFWDSGQPRFDESGQLQWYGDRVMWVLTEQSLFDRALSEPWTTLWVVDQATYQSRFASRKDVKVIATSGHLVCLRIGVA